MAFSPFAMPFIGTLPDVQDIFRKPGDHYVPSEGDIAPPPADNHKGRQHANESSISGGAADIYADERQVRLVSQKLTSGLDAETVQNLLADSPGSAAMAPDPTHQWSVVVGDHAHQLQTTALLGGDNYYSNVPHEEGQSGGDAFPIGTTRFNDVALWHAGAQVMASMDETYHFALCNGQVFAMKFLNRILKSGRSREFVKLHDPQGSGAVGPQTGPGVDGIAAASMAASKRDEAVQEEEEPGAIDKRRKALLRALLMMDQSTPALADALVETQIEPIAQ